MLDSEPVSYQPKGRPSTFPATRRVLHLWSPMKETTAAIWVNPKKCKFIVLIDFYADLVYFKVGRSRHSSAHLRKIIVFAMSVVTDTTLLMLFTLLLFI